MALTFNHDTSLISLTAPHTTLLFMQDLINAIRDEEAGERGIQYPKIANAEGKVDIGGGVVGDITVTLLGSWQLQHTAGNYQAVIKGGQVVGGLGGNPIAYVSGVQVKAIQSVAGTIVATGSGVIAQDVIDIKNAVWEDTTERAEETKGGFVDHLRHLQYSLTFNGEYAPEFNDVPDGSQHRPFNDVAEIIDYAELHKIKNIFLYSEMIPNVGQNVKSFILTGIGLQKIVLEGQDLTNSEFNHVKLEGTYLGSIIAENCFISGMNTTINGEFGNCTFGSSFEVPNNGHALIQHCSSTSDTFIKPSFSPGGISGTGRLEFLGHVGGITITDCNQPTDNVKIIGNGIVELDSTCDDGDIVVIGLIKPIDNSGANCNVQWLNIDPATLSDIPSDVWNHTQ